ncbi:MAG: sigma-54 interaction domain-containing protein [Opitutales bacterium]
MPEGKPFHSLLSQERFNDVLLAAIHSLQEAVLVTDFRDRLLFANASFERLTGHSIAALLGRPVYKALLPPDQWDDLLERNERRRSGQSDLYEMEILYRGGERRRMIGRGTPLLDEAGTPIGTVGVMADMEDYRRLESLQAYLDEEVSARYDTDSIIGDSPALHNLLTQARHVAATDATVLIHGETGTGKELIARAIHLWSGRREKPVIKINCAAIPRELFESEFFGHRKGAFTGATSDKIGRFELAHEGTLFLDEVGELPLEQQGKLLRALQEGEIQRIGENHPRKVDVRVITATNRNLREEVAQKRFREDLYYRLNVFPLTVPSLRERREDIAPLASHFVEHYARRMGKRPPRLTAEGRAALERYPWPGNIRELQNVIERSVILSRGRTLELSLETRPEVAAPEDTSPHASRPSTALPDPEALTLSDLAEMEKQLVLRTLERCRGKLYGRDGAAAMLGLKPTTLQSRLRKWGVRKTWQPADKGRDPARA